MAARRLVDPAMLQGLIQSTETQDVRKRDTRSSDPRFPVLRTPVNEDILVYIPKTNLITTENGEDMGVLRSFAHDYKMGTIYGSIRCIGGLVGGVYDQLGYDGICSGCEAVQEVWELYRRKLASEAERLAVDPQNDPTDILKPVREKILNEMDLRGAEEYVTFVIVHIPTSGRIRPAEDAVKNLKAQFVVWRKKRYDDNILAGLDTLMNNPGHPAGMFWHWKFSYNTGGKQANPRDSAKNAKYSPIVDAQALQVLNQYAPYCEEAAKEFTLLKAAEVVVANQFLFKEDHDKEINKIMVKTRQLIELSDATAVGGFIPSKQNVNPLAGFGAGAGTGGAGAGSASPGGNLGVDNDQAAGAGAGAGTGAGAGAGAGQGPAPGVADGAGQGGYPWQSPIKFGQ